MPWLIAVALGYGTALFFVTRHYGYGEFKPVIQTIGVFGVLLLSVCVWFSFHRPKTASPPTPKPN